MGLDEIPDDEDAPSGDESPRITGKSPIPQVENKGEDLNAPPSNQKGNSNSNANDALPTSLSKGAPSDAAPTESAKDAP